MCDKNMISQICSCIEVLLEVKQKGASETTKKPTNEFEALLIAFHTNIHLAYKEIDTLKDLKSIVTEYLTPCLDEKCESCGILNFFELCLILLKLVSHALLQEKKEASSDFKPSGLLSISQQMTVRKCLQFVVALGIVPNLLPRVGIPQSKRMEYPDVLTNVTFNFNPQQKYFLLIIAVEILLECLKCDAMQGIILFYHGCDLLAALMQICYAPVKKISDSKPSNESQSDPGKASEEFDLKQKLSLLKDKSPLQERYLILKMQENKSIFKPHLEKLMKEMCPSLLMFYLLMFHGISRNSNKILRAPAWFQRECNLRLTKLLLRKNGIATLVNAVLNQTCDMDVSDITTCHTERLNGLARVIIFNPVEQTCQSTGEQEQQGSKHLINEAYMKELSKQVLDLLAIKNNPLQQKILNFVASSIILQVSEYDMKLAKECFWDIILKPLELWTGSDADVIVEEKDLNVCIDYLSTIFIAGDLVLNEPHVKILWPYFQTLFHLVNLINNVSYLKTQVKNMLCKILASVDDEKALSFLKEVSFPAESCPGINVSFLLAEDGDVKEVAKVEEDLYLIQTRCHCIFDLLNEVHNKNLNSSYLLFILKEFCRYHNNVKEGKGDIYDEKYRLTLALLSQEITAWEADLGEAFLSNVPEVIDSLMILLESSHCDDDDVQDACLGEDIIMTVLMFLNSLLMIDDKLTADDWVALQKCVPGLQRLHDCDIEPYLKAVIFNILAYVATHGAGATTESYAEIIKDVWEKCSFESLNILGEAEVEAECSSNEKTLDSNQETSKPKDSRFPSSKSCQGSDAHSSLFIPCKSKVALRKSEKKKAKAKAQKCSEFQSAILDVEDDCIPTKGHGLISLGKLISIKDEETLSHKEEILNILQENLEHEDSYIYLSTIQTLSILAQIDTNLVLPVALKCLLHPEQKSSEYIIKMGEVLVKICRMLGDLTFKYREQMLHAYLVGAKNADPNVRSSSLSNLGEACFHLKFNIEGHWLQEILVCVQSLLITDRDLEVRRCAVMVIYLLLRGVGKDILQVLESNIKGIYMQLKVIYCTADDDVLRLHSQMALEEINSIMRDLLTAKLPLMKEIRIL